MLTVTRRLVGRWIRQPLLDVAAITKRQDVVQAFADDPIARDSLREQLKVSRNPHSPVGYDLDCALPGRAGPERTNAEDGATI